MSLSLLCVTSDLPRAEPYKLHFRDLAAELGCECVIAVDGRDVRSKGYIESVLDDAIALTAGDYVLRLDDDERVSRSMRRWLKERRYESSDHWTFPRLHLWNEGRSVIMNPPYFPDFQTRLSVRAKAGSRPVIHQASPFGAGSIAKVCLEHWCFVAKPIEELKRTCEKYNGMAPGTGRSVVDEIGDDALLADYDGDGSIPFTSPVRKGSLRRKIEHTVET